MFFLFTLPLTLFALRKVPDLCNRTNRYDALKTSCILCDVHLLSIEFYLNINYILLSLIFLQQLVDIDILEDFDSLVNIFIGILFDFFIIF